MSRYQEPGERVLPHMAYTGMCPLRENMDQSEQEERPPPDFAMDTSVRKTSQKEVQLENISLLWTFIRTE